MLTDLFRELSELVVEQKKTSLIPRFIEDCFGELSEEIQPLDHSEEIKPLYETIKKSLSIKLKELFTLLPGYKEDQLLKQFQEKKIPLLENEDEVYRYVKWLYLRINTLLNMAGPFYKEKLENLDIEEKLAWIIRFLEKPEDLILTRNPKSYIMAKGALAESVTILLGIPAGTSKDIPYEQLCEKLRAFFRTVNVNRLDPDVNITIESLYIQIFNYLVSWSVDLETFYSYLIYSGGCAKEPEVDTLHRYLSYQLEMKINSKKENYLRGTILYSLDRYLNMFSKRERYQLIISLFDKDDVPRAPESKNREIRVARSEGIVSELNIFWRTVQTLNLLSIEDLQMYLPVCEYITKRRKLKDVVDQDVYVQNILNSKTPIKKINFKHQSFSHIEKADESFVNDLKNLAKKFLEHPYFLFEFMLNQRISSEILFDHYLEDLGQNRK